MDALTVVGSMVGILAAAGKVEEIVLHYVSSAPKLAASVYSEVNNMRTVLSSLQQFLLNLALAPSGRAALIQLDQLIATFTDGVLIFSELEALVDPLQLAKFRLKPRLYRTIREKDILELLGRLQRFKTSMSLMLNIFQCDSVLTAAQSQQALLSQVASLLESNEALSRRLRNPELFDISSMLESQMDDVTIARADDDNETITLARPQGSELKTTTLETSSVCFGFEDELQSSRVYRRAKQDTCDRSFTSSAERTNAWSIFSSLSLADISIISVIALPLYAPDITNSQHYTFSGTQVAKSKHQSPDLDEGQETCYVAVKHSEDQIGLNADGLQQTTQDDTQPQLCPPMPRSSPTRQWLLPPIRPEFIGKKCLVLDLNETLVHCSFKVLDRADFTIPIEIEGQYHNIYVIKRPGVDKFMKRVGELYEIVVFTTSISRWVDPLLDQLDIHGAVQWRLFRDSCYDHQGDCIKDLSQLGRDLREVIIIDNSPTSYIFHPQHAVPISSWFSDAHDNELPDLIPMLEDLASPQVRDVSLVLDVFL